MRKTLVLAATVAAMLAAFPGPAMSQDRDREDRLENRIENRIDRLEDRSDIGFDSGFFDGGFGSFGDRFDEGGIVQEFEQDAESGDVEQDFEVTGNGDNSNQTVGIQGTSNTGSVQDGFGFVSFDSDIDDFEIEDIGSDLDIGGELDLDSDQSVNQAAVADL